MCYGPSIKKNIQESDYSVPQIKSKNNWMADSVNTNKSELMPLETSLYLFPNINELKSTEEQTESLNNWFVEIPEPPTASGSTGGSSSSSQTLWPNSFLPATSLQMPAQMIPDLQSQELTKAQIKRMKNTEAARQSRKKKSDHMKHLEVQISEMEAQNKDLEKENAILKSENASYQSRVSALEKQVEELHSVLMAFGKGVAQEQTQKRKNEDELDNSKKQKAN